MARSGAHVSTTVLDQLISAPGTLAHVPLDRIRKNPENPRLFFRQEELEELQDSIRQFGVQVPISVYKQGNDFILIDRRGTTLALRFEAES